MIRIIENLAADWRRLEDRIGEVSAEIGELAQKDAPWGGFLSQADVVTVEEGYFMEWFNLDKTSTRSVRTIPLG